MSEQKTSHIHAATEVSEILTDGSNPSNLSLEALVLLINTERLKNLQTRTHNELKELKERQAKVSKLQKLLKRINAVSNNGELDATSNEELKQLLKEAKEMGVDMKQDSKTQNDKLKFNKNEREELIENIRMTIDEFNVKNDTQLQAVNHLMNERNETYLMARSIMKPLHESKVKIAQGIK